MVQTDKNCNYSIELYWQVGKSKAVAKYFEVTAFRPAEGQFAYIFQDIIERKLAEAESEKIKNQLAQSQKLESIGRLAGGVAHDFNNLTGIIMGCAEMAIMKLKKGLSIDAELEGIKKTQSVRQI